MRQTCFRDNASGYLVVNFQCFWLWLITSGLIHCYYKLRSFPTANKRALFLCLCSESYFDFLS